MHRRTLVISILAVGSGSCTALVGLDNDYKLEEPANASSSVGTTSTGTGSSGSGGGCEPGAPCDDSVCAPGTCESNGKCEVTYAAVGTSCETELVPKVCDGMGNCLLCVPDPMGGRARVATTLLTASASRWVTAVRAA